MVQAKPKKGEKFSATCGRWPGAIVAQVTDTKGNTIKLQELPPHEHCYWETPKDTFPESWLPVKEPAKK